MQRSVPTDDPVANVRERVATGEKVQPMLQQAGAGEAPQVYVVQKGDTLWDLSSRFLNDPFKWQLLHQNNPQIVNPDLIYPGEPVTVYPQEIGEISGEAAPVAEASVREEAVEPAVTEEVAEAEISEEVMPEPEVRPDTEGSARAQYLGQFEKKEEIKVFDAQAVELLSKKRAIADYDKTRFVFQRAGSEGIVEFVDQSYIKNAGVILAQEDEESFDRLSSGDRLYINRGSDHGVAKGHRFWVVRNDGPVTHPVTGEKLGNVIRSIGIIQVLETQKNLSTARIKMAYEEISSGNPKLYGIDRRDYVIPYYKPESEFPIKVAEKPVEGYLVGTQGRVVNILTKMLVYVDKGTKDGIVPGTLFKINRPNRKTEDPELEGRVQLPDIAVGEAIVIRSTESTATAYVTYLDREAHIGDRMSTSDSSILFKRPSALLETDDANLSRRIYESAKQTANPYIP